MKGTLFIQSARMFLLILLLLLTTTVSAQFDQLDQLRPPKPPAPPAEAEPAFVGKIAVEVLTAAEKQEQIQVIVTLSEQPRSEIARQEKAVYIPQVKQWDDQIKLLMEPFEADDVVPDPIKQQTKALRTQQEHRLEEMRRAIYNRVMPRVTPQQDRLAQFIEEKLNGTVFTKIYLVNLLSAEIPSTALNQLSLHSDVNSITLDHQGGKMELNKSAGAISAAYLWNLGHDGDGETDVAVVDSGIAFTHDAFDTPPRHDGTSRDFRKGVANPGVANDNDGHGTAVAGIIASNGTIYRGIAHGIDKIINAKVSERTFAKESDVMAAIEWAVRGGPGNSELAEIVNFSLGWQMVGSISNTTNYTRIAQFFDAVVDDLLVPITKSAGNEGNTGSKEKRVTVPGDAYNVFVVGNIDDKNTNIRSDDTINDSSSAGPTRAGRKKPDICAPGTKIITTLTRGNEYGQQLVNSGDLITGTSFAAPHVAGSIALLMDYWTFNPLVIKANLIGTATKQVPDPDGDGWDKAYGWGYLWNYTAYNKRWNRKYTTISNGQSYYVTGTMSPGDRATLVWNRHVDYVASSYPHTVKDLSDLDLYLWDYTNEEINGPALDYSLSWIDNVEQVEYSGTGDKDVLIEVCGYNVPSTVGEESFALQMHSFSRFSVVSPAAPSSQRTSEDISQERIADELGQNFPNPFNPETWIPYAVSEPAAVTLNIYDTNGRQVRQLSLGIKEPGQYFTKESAAYWDGRNAAGEAVASGVYFYYLEAGSFRATRKLIIQK